MADLNLEQGLAVLEGRTKWARFGLFAFIGVSVATIAGQLGEVTGTVDLGETGTQPYLMIAVGLVYIAYAVTFVVSAVLVAMWIYRAHANITAAGAGPLEVSPGWAVGWFFVPIANLFKPFQAMRELWNASHNMSDGYTQDNDPKLTMWWGFWIVSNIITNLAARSMFTGGTTAQSASSLLDVLGSVLSIGAAWFLLQIVREVNAAQRSTLAAASAFA